MTVRAITASLRYRDYRLIWLGQSSHAAALWMEQTARPLLVLAITDGSAVHLGGVVAMRTLPSLLFGVWAGVVSDWFDRKTVLQTTKAGTTSVAVLFAVLMLSGQLELWHVYAASFIRGGFQAFDQPARHSLVGDILPSDLLTNGVALLSSTQNIMRILGAGAGGFLAGFVSLTAAFVVIAVVYSGSVLATQLLQVPSHGRPSEGGIRAMARGLVEGARFAAAEPAIRGVLLLSFVYFTFGMSYMQVFLPLFAVDVLDVGAAGLGGLAAVTGIGAVSAALIIASRQPRHPGRILPLVVVGFGAVLIAFSLSTYFPAPLGLVIPFFLIAFVGMMQTSYMSLSTSSLLHAAPRELRGRVVSLISLDRAMMSAGAALGGFLVAWQGAQLTQIAYGLICIAGGLAIVTFAHGPAARADGIPRAKIDPPSTHTALFRDQPRWSMK